MREQIQTMSHRASEGCDCRACQDAKALGRELAAALAEQTRLTQRLSEVEAERDEYKVQMHGAGLRADNAERREAHLKADQERMREALKVTGDTSDGYHTFNELYAYRKAYHALLSNQWTALGLYDVHKSWRHSDGELCFGGDWFIVSAQTPEGQVTNHYQTDDWALFAVPDRETAAEWDGHTPQEALSRLLTLAALSTPRQP